MLRMKKFGAGTSTRPLRSKKARTTPCFSNTMGLNRSFRPLRKAESTGNMFVNVRNARPSTALSARRYYTSLMAPKRRNEYVSNPTIPSLLKMRSYLPTILKSHPNKKLPKFRGFNSSQNPSKAQKKLGSLLPKSRHQKVITSNFDDPTSSQKFRAEQKMLSPSGINICDEKDKTVAISQMNKLENSQQSAYAEHLKKLKRKNSPTHKTCFEKYGEESKSISSSPKKMKLESVATPKSSPNGFKIDGNKQKPKLLVNAKSCPNQGVEPVTAPQEIQSKKQANLQTTNKSSNANKSGPRNQTMSSAKAKVGATEQTIIIGQSKVNSTTVNKEKSINNKRILPNPIQNTNILHDQNNPSSDRPQMAQSEMCTEKCANVQLKQHNSAYLEHLKKLKKTSKPINTHSSQEIANQKLDVSNSQKAMNSNGKKIKGEKKIEKTVQKPVAISESEKSRKPEEETLKTTNNQNAMDPKGKKRSKLGPRMTGDQVDNIRNSTKTATKVEVERVRNSLNEKKKMSVKPHAQAVTDSYEVGVVEEKEALANSKPADDSAINNLQTPTLTPLMSIKIECPASLEASSRSIPLIFTGDSNIQKQSEFIATELNEEEKTMMKPNLQTGIDLFKEKSSAVGKAEEMAKNELANDTSSVNSLKMSAFPPLMSIKVEHPNLSKSHSRPTPPMLHSNIQKQQFNSKESSKEVETILKAYAQPGKDAYQQTADVVQKKEAIKVNQITDDDFAANNKERSDIAPLTSMKIECCTSSDARPIPSILTVDSNIRKQGIPVTKNYVHNANSNLLTCIPIDEGAHEEHNNTQVATLNDPVRWEFSQGAIRHACFSEASECASAEDINLSIDGTSDSNLPVTFDTISPVAKQSGDFNDQSSSEIVRKVVQPVKSHISTNVSTRPGHATTTTPITTYEKMRQLAAFPLSVENKQPSTEEIMKFNEDEFVTIDSTFADDEVESKSTAQPHGRKKVVASDFFSDAWTDDSKNVRSRKDMIKRHDPNHMEQHQLLSDKRNISTCSNPKTRPNLRKESDVISVVPSVELDSENLRANMSIDSAIAAGFQFLQPVSGYHCILCQTFYQDYPTALHHCTQLSHKMKVVKQLGPKNRSTTKS